MKITNAKVIQSPSPGTEVGTSYIKVNRKFDLALSDRYNAEVGTSIDI